MLSALAPTEAAIRLRAYHLNRVAAERGHANDPHNHWQAAESQLREEHELMATYLAHSFSANQKPEPGSAPVARTPTGADKPAAR